MIGTNRHESRRIDEQLRGRAGRQGDPGSSQFFVSREDPIVLRYAGGDSLMSHDQCQRIAEGQHLEVRIFLRKYESVIEAQRRKIANLRQRILAGAAPVDSAAERLMRLQTVDELWADYLAAVAEIRSGSAWITLGYGNALGHYLREVHGMFGELERAIEVESQARLAARAAASDPPTWRRGATWTYLTTDEPFGRMTERVLRRLFAGRKAARGGAS